MLWYSHLFQNFPQFVVIHIVKGFGVINKTEVKVKSLSHVRLFATPCSLPGSSIHGIFQARVLEWVAIAFSKLGFNNMWTENFQMFKLDLEKAEEPEIKLPTSIES